MKQLWRQQSGDTIVEVLVAIVIVATILGGAYVTANRSLLATRESQERGEALNLAEGQLEALRGMAMTATSTDPNSVFGYTKVFCISGTTIETAAEDASLVPYANGQLPPANSNSDADYTRVAGAPCAVNPQGSTYNYDIAIERCDISNDNGNNAYPNCASYAEPAASALFIVHVRWDSTSNGRNEVTLQYRVYEAPS